MAILTPDEKKNHFNLTLAERQQAGQDVRVALAERRQEILRLIEGKLSSVMAHGAMLISDMAVHELYTGLQAILNEDELSDRYAIAQFFSHFFSVIYAKADAAEKRGLIQRLTGQLESEQGLIPLLCEFEVAFTYLSQGNEVHLVDLAGGNEKSYDLIVKNNGFDINVEVKSVRYENCIPAPIGAISRALSTLSDWADRHINGPSIFEVKLTLKKVPRPTYKQVQDSVGELLCRAEPKSGHWSNKVFRLNIKKITKNRRDKATVEAMSDALANNIPPKKFELIIPTDLCNGYCLVSVGFDQLPSHVNLIKRAVKSACDQLPKDKLRVVHVSLVKTGFLNPDNFGNFSRQYIRQDKEIISQFRKKGSETLVGVYLACDSFYVSQNDSVGMLSSYPYMQLLANASSPYIGCYIKNFMPSLSEKEIEGWI